MIYPVLPEPSLKSATGRDGFYKVIELPFMDVYLADNVVVVTGNKSTFISGAIFLIASYTSLPFSSA